MLDRRPSHLVLHHLGIKLHLLAEVGHQVGDDDENNGLLLVAWQLVPLQSVHVVVLATTLVVVLVLEHVGHNPKLFVLQIDIPWHASSQVDFLELIPSLSKDYGDVLVGTHHGGLAELDVQGVAEDLKQGGHQGFVFEFDRPRKVGLAFQGGEPSSSSNFCLRSWIVSLLFLLNSTS